jgi:hypothetical protein
MSEKTASSQSREMRQPITRKKVYGRARKAPAPPQNGCLLPAEVATAPLSAVSVDTPAPAKAARLDKQETIELAKATLQSICVASDAPSNAKATAARTLLELVGALGRHADPSSMNTIPASEMSLEQLEARIASLVSH